MLGDQSGFGTRIFPFQHPGSVPGASAGDLQKRRNLWSNHTYYKWRLTSRLSTGKYARRESPLQSEMVQGTLDMLILQTLVPGPAHGQTIAHVYSPNGQPLSSNERHLRRQLEWTNLLRASLRHVGLPDDIVTACRISLTPSPLLSATERAERYRPQSEKAPFVHVRLDFRGLVRGPLLVGDRRCLGFGLLAPAIG